MIEIQRSVLTTKGEKRDVVFKINNDFIKKVTAINFVPGDEIECLTFPSYYYKNGKEHLIKTIDSNALGQFNGNSLSNISNYYIHKVIIEEGIRTIRSDSFFVAEIKELIIKRGCSLIEPKAFFGAKIEKIQIEDGLIEIGDSAFNKCSKLKEITIPNSCEKIGIQAFKNCENITNIVWPEKCITINPQCFQNCYELKSIEINSPLINICINAFYKSGIKNLDLSKVIFGNIYTAENMDKDINICYPSYGELKIL